MATTLQIYLNGTNRCLASLTLLSSIMAIIMMGAAVGQSTSIFSGIPRAKAAASHVFKLIDYKPSIDSSSTDGMNLEVSGKIEFKNVHLQYPSRPDSKVLQGINLNIEPGQVIALVGQSGCGKSSIISLLERFYDTSDGQVLIDSHDIRELNVKSLRSQIGLVGQEPILFIGTIAENIRYGKPNATMDEVVEAAKASNAHTFIMQFPEGYNTYVGEGGVQLSGGQKQRVVCISFKSDNVIFSRQLQEPLLGIQRFYCWTKLQVLWTLKMKELYKKRSILL
jgi:ABC-type multidrug transport system fused ATPase/permease subunit